MRTVVCLLAVLLALTPVTQAVAQAEQQEQESQATEIARQDTIRIPTRLVGVMGGEAAIGHGHALERDWDSLTPNPSPFLAFAVQDTGKVSLAKPLLIGLGAGAAFGALIGALGDLRAEGGFEGPAQPDDDCFDKSCTLIGAAIGAGFGSLFGLVYWAAKTDAAPNPFLNSAGGLLFGAFVGGALGAEGERQASEAIREGEEPNACADEDCILLGAAVLGGVGMVLGFVGSFFTGTEKEDEAKLDWLHVNVVPEPNRFTLVASVRF